MDSKASINSLSSAYYIAANLVKENIFLMILGAQISRLDDRNTDSHQCRVLCFERGFRTRIERIILAKNKPMFQNTPTTSDGSGGILETR